MKKLAIIMIIGLTACAHSPKKVKGAICILGGQPYPIPGNLIKDYSGNTILLETPEKEEIMYTGAECELVFE